MAITVTIVFPNEANAEYDITYYVIKHMPMIEERLAKYGLKSWSGTKYSNVVDNSPPPYAFGSMKVWEDCEQIKAAFAGPKVEEIMGDIANFGNKQAVSLVGEVMHGGTGD